MKARIGEMNTFSLQNLKHSANLASCSITLGSNGQTTHLLNLRVDSSIDLDHNPDQVDHGEGINGVLYRRKVASGRVLVDGEGVRREDLVLCWAEDGVLEATNEVYPSHELPLDELGLRLVDMIWGVSTGLEALCVAEDLAGVEEEEEEEN